MPKLPEGFNKRGNKYQYRFRINGSRKTVSGDTIEECKIKADELLKLAAVKVSKNVITFYEYSQEWLQAISPTVKQGTVYDYSKQLDAIYKHMSSIRLQDIDRRDLLKLQNDLYGRLAASTTNRYMLTVKQILNAAVADKVIPFSPYAAIKGVKPKENAKITIETNHRALTVADQKLFFHYAADSWYYELFQFLLNTGLRIGEAGALTWNDIKENHIEIRKTVSRRGNSDYYVSNTPKTNCGSRDIPMTNTIRQILASQKNKVAEVCGISYCKQSSRIFCPLYKPDKLLTNTTADHALEAVFTVMRKADCHIDVFSIHAFRDTFATRLVEQKVQLLTVSKLLGHASINVTAKLYAHVLPDTKAKELQSVVFEM